MTDLNKKTAAQSQRMEQQILNGICKKLDAVNKKLVRAEQALAKEELSLRNGKLDS